MFEVSLAKKKKQERNWLILGETVIILIIVFQAILPAGGETQYVGGRTYTFTGPAAPAGEIYSYHWMVTNGTPKTSSDASFQWTSPQVKEPTKVLVNLTVERNNATCLCPGKSELELLIVPSGQPKISLKKDCIFTAPVRVGDSITYTYNVTNTGGVPLTDINLTDIQDWGSDCHPVYVKGDNGDGILSPGETWWYECKYTAPDPSDYQQQLLHTMSDDSSEEAIIQKLTDMKAPLEMKMCSLESKRRQFHTVTATLAIGHGLLNGSNYTLYNYTNEITGESFSRWLDSAGRISRSDYYDPVIQAVLTTEYNPDGSLKSDAIQLLASKEYMKIEYDVPTKGYKNYTIIDYNTGDTLLLLIDNFGNIVSKEYKKTPGLGPAPSKGTRLENTATVTAKAPDGSTVQDISIFKDLWIYPPFPVLKITKTADSNTVNPGGTINYTITYENTGGDAHQIVVKEKYDPNLIFKSASRIPDAGTIDTWTLGDLSSGESGIIKIAAKVSQSAVPGSSVMNVATVTCNESATDRTTINTTVEGAGLNITKSASRNIVKAGGTLTYTIKYWNNGTGVQTNVIINDSLDDNVIFLNSSPLYTSHSGNHYWWNVGDLNAGASGKITIDIKVKDNVPDSLDSIHNIYKINSANQTSGSTLETMVVSSLWIKKTADKTSYSPGDDVTYTILYGNEEDYTANSVNVTDVLPNVELLSVSPAPTSVNGNTLIWMINKTGYLGPLENGSIQLMVHIPERPELKFNEESSVRGQGYVYVNKRLSTVENNSLINKAYISGYYEKGPDRVWDNHSSTVTILGAAGTELSTYEHGSGYYKESEQTSLRSKNYSISLNKDITAQHNNTVFSLPRGRSISYKSLWYDRTGAKNYILSDEISENYLYMDSLDKKSSFSVDMNQTVYHSESDFSGGIARINYEKCAPSSMSTIQEINENYHGSFRVLESVDSYGDSTKYIKSAKGSGFVSSDKRVNRPPQSIWKIPDLLQRSYEYGSGYYNSEESSQLSLVTKSAKMAYSPENLTAGTVNISYASLWNEGLSTIDPSNNLKLSEDTRSASYINKDAWMTTSALSFMGEFNGSMEIKAMMRPQRLEIDQIDQSLIGNFTINTAITGYTATGYFYPHVNICKKAIWVDENTMLFLINVTNDGNGLLRSLNVTDRLPDGMIFINSSLRPDINGQFVNWTIPALDIGKTLTIKLRTDIENDRYPYRNAVEVTAQYNGHILTASNSTSSTPYIPPYGFVPASLKTAYLANVSNNSTIQGHWGEWNPPAYFNMTSKAPNCFKEIDDYYNDLDKSESEGCSPYDVP